MFNTWCSLFIVFRWHSHTLLLATWSCCCVKVDMRNGVGFSVLMGTLAFLCEL
jgi:hypothetical protein